MKNIITTLLLLFFLNLWSQNIDRIAFLNAEKMTSFYNNKDFLNYVNYVFPEDYNNDVTKKGELAEGYKKMSSILPDKIEIIKVLKTSNYNNQYQALFLERDNNNEQYILGISNDVGKNWFFTFTYSKQVHFDQIIKKIPTIDPAFSKIIDPKFGKRVSFEIGKSVTPFNFTDINGNLLSSDSLKGKTIVLNFWHPQCSPCIAELPELNNLVERMKDKEIVFIAPAINTTKEKITEYFLPKHPFKYQIVLINQDDYSITSFPTNIIIDKNLKVIEKLEGFSPENIRKIEQKINEITQ